MLDLLLDADGPDAAHRALRDRRTTSKDRETLGDRRRELADQAAALERDLSSA